MSPRSSVSASTRDDWVSYLARAEKICKARGAALTPIRQAALEILFRHRAGLKAYDLLAELREKRANATPPTVYRALDFLMEQEFVHRIGRNNRFVACHHQSHRLPALFLVCPQCGGVLEVQDPSLTEALLTTLNRAGYQLDRPEIEIGAICPACGPADGDTADSNTTDDNTANEGTAPEKASSRL